MVQVHEAVGVRHGQRFGAMVADDLLAEATILDAVRGAAAEHSQDKNRGSQSGHALTFLQQFAQVDDRRVGAGNVVGHDQRMIREQTELAAIQDHRAAQWLLR